MKLSNACIIQGFIGTRTLGMPRWHNSMMKDIHLRIWVTFNSISSSVTLDIHPEMTSGVQSSGCCSFEFLAGGAMLWQTPDRIPTWLGGPRSQLSWSISRCLWSSVFPQLSYKEVCISLLSSVCAVKKHFSWTLSLPRPFLTRFQAFFWEPLFSLPFGALLL